MRCPFCNSEDNRVVDSRSSDEINAIRRRRVCDNCGNRFTTYEKIEMMPLTIIKKGGIREAYDRSKVEAGIVRSCHKRPISRDAIDTAVNEIENALYAMDEKEIPSSVVGELVMEKLRALDQVAYVRFASIYREFKDVNTFMDELKKLLN